MANSKHAHFRYNLLDRRFRNSLQPRTFEQLLDEINEDLNEVYPGESISVRTLRNDIALFKSKQGFNAPLKTQKVEGKDVYCYTDTNFSIAQRKVLPYEQYLIDASQQLLERFDQNPKYDKLSEALVLFQEEEGANTIPDYEKILFYDKNEAYTGLSHLKPMFLAVKNKNVLKVTYQGFNDDFLQEYIFHPYVLKQYNQRWFVFGYNETKNINYWSIPLDDRLIKFEKEEDKAIKIDDTNWNTFFNEMVGVRKQSITQEQPISERVVLKFNPKRLEYFKTKPIHPYWDEFAEKGKEDQVFFETIINLELVQQLLSYGKDVEVLEPESLKIKMLEHAKTMQEYYNN